MYYGSYMQRTHIPQMWNAMVLGMFLVQQHKNILRPHVLSKKCFILIREFIYIISVIKMSMQFKEIKFYAMKETFLTYTSYIFLHLTWTVYWPQKYKKYLKLCALYLQYTFNCINHVFFKCIGVIPLINELCWHTTLSFFTYPKLFWYAEKWGFLGHFNIWIEELISILTFVKSVSLVSQTFFPF